MNRPMMLFKDLEIGYSFPRYEYELTEQNVEKYFRAVGGPGAADENGKKLIPSGIAALFTWGSYRNFIETPAGGLHAKQIYQYRKPLYLGDKLSIQAKVLDKYIKNERNYVILQTEISRNSEIVILSEMTVIWAK